MRQKIRCILIIILCLCMVLPGCKGSSEKTKETDNKEEGAVSEKDENGGGSKSDHSADQSTDTSSSTDNKATAGNTGNSADTGSNSTGTESSPDNSAGTGNTSVITVDGKNQKNTPPEITGVVAVPEDGIGVAGTDYVELAAGPADDWEDIKVPYFNPLGSRKLYEGGYINYRQDSSLKLEVLDNYITDTFIVQGEYWGMKIYSTDFSIFWLRAYAKKLGADFYETAGDTAIFRVVENENSQYWVKAELNAYGCVLHMIRIDMVPVGKAQTFKPGDYSNNTVSFYTDCVKGKLQSLTVTLAGPDNCGVRIDCKNDREYGGYTKMMRKEMGNAEEINTKKTNTFVFDNIPITDGQVQWTLDWSSLRGTGKPDEITFFIENISDIEPVKNGEELGMLRIVGVPMGEIEVLTGDGVQRRHPDFQETYLIGTRDKDGNTVFSLPSGYYNVRFGSSQIMGDKDRPPLSIDAPGVMRLIPVNTGEITTVTIPREIELTYSLLQKQYGTFSSAGNIEITDNKDKGDTATVSIVINDPLERDVFPEKEDITIMENGIKAVVTDIKRETAPADIVLVLDTSGSMGDNMKAAVEAAKKFVGQLPDNTNIRFIQFEQKITEHKADNKAKVIAALDTVKANGGTAMYDATDKALKLLAGKEKPYVVLFSDGADSRELKNMGKGSTLTKDQILKNIKASGVTVLTIGFGEGHDPRVLVEMSKASKDGAYFAAMEPSALEQAFAAVSGKFGNQFTITYERPTAVKASDSDIPVVSFMIDRSGSMDMDPASSTEDVGYRINIVKNLFHDFVMKLPEGTLMQLGSFRTPPTQCPYIYYDQITTDRKAPILQGLGEFISGGGTPIVEALTTAYCYLSAVPSSKKTLIYFTDAALACKTESEKVQLEEILAKMKKDGFRILFAGLGNEKFAELYKEAFTKAASISGGEYIITSNINDIRKKLDGLMNRINQTEAGDIRMNFSISVNCKAEDGSRMDYGAQKSVENFSVREKSGEVIKPELIQVTTGEVYNRYNRTASMLLYGSDKPNQDSTILEYIPYENEAAPSGSFSAVNKEIRLTVKEAYYMNPFKEIDLKNQQQFLALNIEITMADNAAIKTYQIPSVFRHFYVSLNNEMSPASQATWLAETPLSEPGNPSVTITDKNKKTGILVFIVERKLGQRVNQLSLHFYDTNYGHISIPLAGSIPSNSLEINALAKKSPAKLSDTFSLTVSGKNDVTELAGSAIYQVKGSGEEKNTTFRVIEGQFDSKVQALLNIDPTERFLYAVETDQGPLVTKMSDVVYNIPMGFTGSTMIAPGASSPVRMPFQIPLELAGSSSYLFADLATGGVNIPVTAASPYKTGSLGKKWSHEYFDITINALRPVSKDNDRLIVLDFTVSDKKDGFGLRDISGLLALAKTGSAGDSAKYFGGNIASGRNGLGNLSGNYETSNVVSVNRDTDDLLYSASKDWAVLDGAARRGILLFYLPNGTDLTQWKLNCGVIEDLSQPIETAYYEYPALLSKRQEVKRDTEVELQLREAVTAVVSKYQATRTTSNSYTAIGLSQDENVGRQSITPALTIHGTKILESVVTDDDFLKVMYAVSCIPNGETYQNIYSPEAVLTQGWGTELDLSRLAIVMLSRLGYQPRIVTVKLTTAGNMNFEKITGLKVINQIPGIAYKDSQGRQKVFVIPFMRDISELLGLAYVANENVYNKNFESMMSQMKITVHAQIIKQPGGMAQAEAFNSLNAILGGGGDSTGDQAVYEDITLFDQQLSRTDLSLDAVDISFSPIGTSADGQHEIIAALVDTKQGIIYNDKLYIDTSFYNIESVTVTIEAGNNRKVTHTTYLKKGEKLNSIFQTLAFNVPGMTETAANTLQSAVEAKASEGKDAGDYATVKWIGHASINRFVRELTAFEEENMPLFGVKAARTASYPLILMVTMISDGSKATATVDVMQHETQVLNNPDNKNKDGFSSVYGIFVSLLEAYALGEDKATGFLQVWMNLPENTPIFVIPREKMEEFAKAFEENGGPAKLVERLRAQAKQGTRSMFIVPKSPADIGGKPRYSWLEITEGGNGTQIISVSETGERSGMAEYIVLNAASVGVKPLSAEGAAGFLYGITCIDWGIAAYSLQTENYAAILAQTKMLVSGIGELLATIETAGDITSKLGESFGDPQKQLETLEAAYKILLNQNKLNVDLAKLHDISKNFVLLPSFDVPTGSWQKSEMAGSAQGYSFSDGFKAAVQAYFP